ncbi:hypothetical protein [Mycoplana dimorpha]|uniref:hypothetical protein n=1 Tax=Mycoplana dimorpha TaxID=28320 RepID=UPI0011B21D60|nr:hypothetical protein [Mycoplana dimorpha]
MDVRRFQSRAYQAVCSAARNFPVSVAAALCAGTPVPAGKARRLLRAQARLLIHNIATERAKQLAKLSASISPASDQYALRTSIFGEYCRLSGTFAFWGMVIRRISVELREAAEKSSSIQQKVSKSPSRSHTPKEVGG